VLNFPDDEATYVLVGCRDAAAVPAVRAELEQAHPQVSVYTASQFSWSSRLYWLVMTKVGVAIGLVSLLSLGIGTLITTQTLYAATSAALREYAVLEALGIPRGRLRGYVIRKALLLGIGGVLLALPVSLALVRVADLAGIKSLLPWPLLVTAAVITVVMAVLSGVLATRSLRQVDPGVLVR
jgi:putative ABC transport system permease protein